MKQTISRANAFTLVEMLVAIAVLSILLAVVFVPLRLAINSLHIGQAQTTTQNAAQATLDNMERDFRRAVYVFPNTALANVTDRTPYTSNNNGLPYVRSQDPNDIFTSATNPAQNVPQKGFCELGASNGSISWGNTARVDMILAKKIQPYPSPLPSPTPTPNPSAGQTAFPLQPGYTIVTYYARRQNVTLPYDPVDNPLVLYRAEFPYRGTLPTGSTTPNVASTRYDACSSTGNSNAATIWMAHNVYGEANLEPLCVDATDSANTIGGSHTAAIPRGVGLVASQAYRLNSNLNPTPTPPTAADAPLVPDTSFQLSDTNGDGKINQVTVSLALETFDTNQGASVNSNGQPKGQIVRARRVFDLPNVR